MEIHAKTHALFGQRNGVSNKASDSSSNGRFHSCGTVTAMAGPFQCYYDCNGRFHSSVNVTAIAGSIPVLM